MVAYSGASTGCLPPVCCSGTRSGGRLASPAVGSSTTVVTVPCVDIVWKPICSVNTVSPDRRVTSVTVVGRQSVDYTTTAKWGFVLTVQRRQSPTAGEGIRSGTSWLTLPSCRHRVHSRSVYRRDRRLYPVAGVCTMGSGFRPTEGVEPPISTTLTASHRMDRQVNDICFHPAPVMWIYGR